MLASLLPTASSRGRLRQLLERQDEDPDWTAIFNRSVFHHTAPMLRLNLAATGQLGLVPSQIRNQLNEVSRTSAARHLAYVSETRRLAQALGEAGVSALPLKGAALMLGGYYSEAGLREATDLDLLIPPSDMEKAESVVEACGYLEMPGRRNVRPRQRLENERNHLWPRRGPAGLILELHHRAFRYVRGARDFTFAEMFDRAVFQPGGPAQPDAPDLALHLIHHTIVDLGSTGAILRTLADLDAIFTRQPAALERLKDRAREIGFAGAADLAVATLRMIADGRLEEIEHDPDVALLIETALAPSPASLAVAARILEYFDLRDQPLQKIGNLASLLFTSRAHLEQLYGNGSTGSALWRYLRRPWDLARKFNWASLAPATLRRAWRLRRIAGARKGPPKSEIGRG